MTAPGIDLDPKLFENFRRAIQFKEIDLPNADGEIEQATLGGKYLVTRAGQLVWTTLIINQKPGRFTREAIHSFGIKFESRFGRELKYLYSKYQGNVGIFKEATTTRESVEGIIDEVFHLNLTLPHKLGFPTGRKMSKKTQKVWELAEDLAHKSKGHILLGNLFTEVKKLYSYDNKDITDSIYNLVQYRYLNPMTLEQFKRKFG